MKRRFLAPEVVQTSQMDCGPASLKALLEGHGISVSYGRLREACQTDVDGTSIDTIEAAAVGLGLDAAQVMAPLDHLPLAEAGLLPCLVVVRQPGGATHFVIVWRRHGPWLQLMDPAVGRRFVSVRQFLTEVYIHTMAVDAAGWREWAASDSFLKPLDSRMKALGIPRAVRKSLAVQAAADASWKSLGRLDAAVRMAEALARNGGIRRGRMAAKLVAELSTKPVAIPDLYWSVRPDAQNEANVLMSGAVMVSVQGRRKEGADAGKLSPELAAALTERANSPGRDLWRLLRHDARIAPGVVLPAMALAAGGVVVEALLLRGLFDVSRELAVSGQRLAAVGGILAFLAVLLLLEWPVAASLLRLGRKLEGRLRVRFLAKIPRLGDRYFQSRLVSDMAERSHTVHTVRTLPEQAGYLARAVFEMAFTVAGIAWLFPESAPIAALMAAIAVVVPLAAQPALASRDLRWRTHTGALSRFYLDAMLGLVSVRAHGAERALRREQEGMLAEWARAGLSVQKTVAAVEGVQFLAGLCLAAWLLLRYLQPGGDPAGVLLLAYWTLNLPVLGQEIGAAAWQYPSLRNITLRLLEPLGAPEEPVVAVSKPSENAGGASISLEGVTVRAAGHVILDDVHLTIAPGERVGIVGPSGAGKSSLVGLLLGWHRPAVGQLLVDGRELDAALLAALRRETAWVDPQVQLWNRSLFDNLRYGGAPDESLDVERALEQADLRGVLRKLPDGLQSMLGEGGALVSGGEGQRVRFGRALSKSGVRLAILDEPARGLDREKRRLLLDRAREMWPQATVLCITHDVGDTLSFPRVLVVENAKIVEDGNPHDLAADPGSRYRALLDAEHAVRSGMWSDAVWRRLRLEGGKVVEQQRKDAACRT